MSTLLYVCLDGLGDDPIPALDGRTPLEAAETPHLDALATRGATGTVVTVGPGIAPESDIGVFGILGYVCAKLDCEPAPMILGFILGPLMEENLRRAMLLSRGDPTVFFTKPISAAFMIAAIVLLVAVALPAIRKKREQAFAEEAS